MGITILFDRSLTMKITIGTITLNLRPCRDDDYWYCYRLLRKNMEGYHTTHLGGWSPEKFRERFQKEKMTIIEHRSRRIGYYQLGLYEQFAYLHEFHLSGNYRGKGLGTALLSVMEKSAKKKGYSRLRLKVFKDNPVKSLYIRQGYTQVEDADNSWVLEKKL